MRGRCQNLVVVKGRSRLSSDIHVALPNDGQFGVVRRLTSGRIRHVRWSSHGDRNSNERAKAGTGGTATHAARSTHQAITPPAVPAIRSHPPQRIRPVLVDQRQRAEVFRVASGSVARQTRTRRTSGSPTSLSPFFASFAVALIWLRPQAVPGISCPGPRAGTQSRRRPRATGSSGSATRSDSGVGIPNVGGGPTRRPTMEQMFPGHPGPSATLLSNDVIDSNLTSDAAP